MKNGKVGGTWLGMSVKGKFASLLNIIQGEIDKGKKGRGKIIISSIYYIS